jgi:hypothetical protein
MQSFIFCLLLQVCTFVCLTTFICIVQSVITCLCLCVCVCVHLLTSFVVLIDTKVWIIAMDECQVHLCVAYIVP